jgi:hypothetical protein|tara:strand:- start:418 stop:885 length:468 start_codon:yes stop_codon:yes gene_type:complete
MRTIIISFILIMILQSCGFKIVEQTDLGNFNIVEIDTQGEKRINHMIKNKLLFVSQKIEKNKIKIKINTIKNKSIKEKNIKNEVTKYNLSITSIVEYQDINEQTKDTFTLSKSGNFAVEERNTQTINSEKELVKLLTERISSQIIDQLILRLDDY